MTTRQCRCRCLSAARLQIPPDKPYAHTADPADGIGVDAEAGPRPRVRRIGDLECVDADRRAQLNLFSRSMVALNVTSALDMLGENKVPSF